MTESTLRKTFKKVPMLRTARLFLRALQLRDAADMYEYAGTSLATRYLSWLPYPNLDTAKIYLSTAKKRYRNGTLYDWAVVDAQSGKMIGTCGFTSFDLKNNSAEIGYVLNPNYWGKGLMAEAVRAVWLFGFEKLNLQRIEAKYFTENRQSRRVMDKVGMRFEGIARQSFLCHGNYMDLGVCAILRDEFYKRNEGTFL